MQEIEDKIKASNPEQILSPKKTKKKSKLEEKANSAAGASDDSTDEEPSGKKIKKAADKNVPVVNPEEDFEEFAPVDIGDLGE